MYKTTKNNVFWIQSASIQIKIIDNVNQLLQICVDVWAEPPGDDNIYNIQKYYYSYVVISMWHVLK